MICVFAINCLIHVTRFVQTVFNQLKIRSYIVPFCRPLVHQQQHRLHCNVYIMHIFLIGHQQRVTIVRYHPTASNILVSAAMDNTVRIWDLSDFSEIGALEGHTNQVSGRYCLRCCRFFFLLYMRYESKQLDI